MSQSVDPRGQSAGNGKRCRRVSETLDANDRMREAVEGAHSEPSATDLRPNQQSANPRRRIPTGGTSRTTAGVCRPQLTSPTEVAERLAEKASKVAVPLLLLQYSDAVIGPLATM